MGSQDSPSALDQLFDQISTRAESSVQALIEQRKQLDHLRAEHARLLQQHVSVTAALSQLEAQQSDLEARYQQQLAQNQQLLNENTLLNQHLQGLADKLNAFAEAPIQRVSDSEETFTVTELGDQPATEGGVQDKFSAKDILMQWSERYPQAFSRSVVQPLKIGIHEDLAANESLPDHWIRRALASYVRQPRYLRTIKSGAVRTDLVGGNAGFVTAEEAQHAKAQLDAIRQQRQQKEQALKEKQEVKRLQSKLAQLVGRH